MPRRVKTNIAPDNPATNGSGVKTLDQNPRLLFDAVALETLCENVPKRNCFSLIIILYYRF